MHGHRLQQWRAEGGDHGHVGRVPSASDQDPALTQAVVARIERPPPIAQPDLHPRGEVHRRWVRRHVHVGYLPDMDVPPDPAPLDFAAWMEVWLGDRWWTFDPRNNRLRKGRILIGCGRDASDVAMVTTFGAPLLESMTVVAREEPE